MSGLDRFKDRRGEVISLRELAHGPRTDSPRFQTWRTRTQRLIDDTFGSDSKESSNFNSISFTPYVGARVVTADYSTPDPDPVEPFLRGCDRAYALLDGIVADMEDGWIPAGRVCAAESNDRVARILDRLHRVARKLGRRQRGRSPFDILDEYDVQDLLHALLEVEFDDVREEEFAPSSAGGSSRVDFLLKSERIVIEVKMARKGLADRELREQLGADITHYAAHPDCGALYCFVYDPNHLVRRPVSIETDLSVKRNDMPVRVMIRPQE